MISLATRRSSRWNKHMIIIWRGVLKRAKYICLFWSWGSRTHVFSDKWNKNTSADICETHLIWSLLPCFRVENGENIKSKFFINSSNSCVCINIVWTKVVQTGKMSSMTCPIRCPSWDWSIEYVTLQSNTICATIH